MEATLALKKSPDRIIIAGFGMLVALVIGGAGGYAVKGLTAPASAVPLAPSTAGVAAPASDQGFAKRALRIELHDQKSQSSVAAPAAAHRARITQQ